nr:hypothetical protein F46C8.8 - Caenorhabditis elegans [Caenorhabditis elegans]
MELSGNIMNGNGGSEQEIRPRFQGMLANAKFAQPTTTTTQAPAGFKAIIDSFLGISTGNSRSAGGGADEYENLPPPPTPRPRPRQNLFGQFLGGGQAANSNALPSQQSSSQSAAGGNLLSLFVVLQQLVISNSKIDNEVLYSKTNCLENLPHKSFVLIFHRRTRNFMGRTSMFLKNWNIKNNAFQSIKRSILGLMPTPAPTTTTTTEASPVQKIMNMFVPQERPQPEQSSSRGKLNFMEMFGLVKPTTTTTSAPPLRALFAPDKPYKGTAEDFDGIMNALLRTNAKPARQEPSSILSQFFGGKK